METDQNEILSEEELLKKHRQEKKDLQAKIQALKKTATKGDRKKKKEVQETIDKLENELELKHAEELQKFAPMNGENEMVTDDLPGTDHLPTDHFPGTDDLPGDDQELTAEPETTRMSRAQKRRNKKHTADKEREKRIADQEEINKQGPRVLELNTITQLLQDQGLQIHNIPADGNCLYCAIDHQLETIGRDGLGISKLRKLTAGFMRDNKEEFLPFMCNDNDEVVDEAQFEKYCKDVANTKMWGGQLELMALSNVLKCPIKVIQSLGPSTVQGENYEGPPLVITYHKHMYRLGEHYNSTVKLVETEDGVSSNIL